MRSCTTLPSATWSRTQSDAPASLPQGRRDFCARWWLKVETRRRNRRTRLVRIRRHDSIAVRQQHIGAFDTQVFVDMQIKLLKRSLHRTRPRQQCQLISFVALYRSDLERVFDVLQI